MNFVPATPTFFGGYVDSSHDPSHPPGEQNIPNQRVGPISTCIAGAAHTDRRQTARRLRLEIRLAETESTCSGFDTVPRGGQKRHLADRGAWPRQPVRGVRLS